MTESARPTRRSSSWTVPVTVRLWVATAEPWVLVELVIFAVTRYPSAAGKA